MTYNYHTHTKRCSHAKGEVEEYIIRAIEGGITHMGFSDHFPHICSDGFEHYDRVPVREAKDYVAEINSHREKYKDKIDIKIGFEMEYFPGLFDFMLKKAIEYGGEYIILGEHYIEEESPNGVHTFLGTDDIEFLKKYVDCVISAIKSGAYTYIAHPDGFYYTGDTSEYAEEMRRICICSREYNVPLELNFLGIRDNRRYPDSTFWKVAGEERCPVTFGFDAHTVSAACDRRSLKVAQDMVKEYNLNYIGKPEVVLIQNLKTSL